MKSSIFSAVVAMILLPAWGMAQTPATAPTAGIKPGERVEIFPFTSVSQPAQSDWVGRGIQESLQNDISHTGASLVLPGHNPAAADDPVTVAKQNQADIAVVGTYQTAGEDVRVNGHLIDTATNTTIGSFAATGPQKNLFGIEDALGEQMRKLLPAAPVAQQEIPVVNQPVMQSAPTPSPVIVYESAPAVSYPPPSVNYYYSTTPDYGYGYPYYGYGYGYPFGFYGGGVIIGGFGGFHHDRDRDFDRGFGDRGFIGRSGFGVGSRGFSGGTTFGGGRGSIGVHGGGGFAGHAGGGFAGHAGGGHAFGGHR
jgi:TolB-like protein